MTPSPWPWRRLCAPWPEISWHRFGLSSLFSDQGRFTAPSCRACNRAPGPLQQPRVFFILQLIRNCTRDDMAAVGTEVADKARGWRRAGGAPPLVEVFRSVPVRNGSFVRKLVGFLGPGYIV